MNCRQGDLVIVSSCSTVPDQAGVVEIVKDMPYLNMKLKRFADKPADQTTEEWIELAEATIDSYFAETERLRASAAIKNPMEEHEWMRLFLDLNSAQANSPIEMFRLIVRAVESKHGIK